MPRLIWVFAGRTCHFAGFVMRRFRCKKKIDCVLCWLYTIRTPQGIKLKETPVLNDQKIAVSIIIFEQCGFTAIFRGFLIMTPTLKKLVGLLLLACPWFRPSLCLMHAISYGPCILGFPTFIYRFLRKIADTYGVFLSALSPSLELCPFEKILMKSCQQGISKSIWARDLKLGQLIGDDV